MIRKFRIDDLEYVMSIWLNSNMQAHDFIPKSYWINNYEMVKEILPKSEVYVYETKTDVIAFIGVENGYIAGVFVSENMRSNGIGKLLLEKCKSIHNDLSLSVYEKNKGALKFYQREGFIIDKTQIDKNTGEPEYIMKWEK